MTEKIKAEGLVQVVKNMSIKILLPKDVEDAVYRFDEEGKISTNDINRLIEFIHKNQKSWGRPKTTDQLISEILIKMGKGPRKNNTKPLTKDELILIHEWVIAQ